MRALVTGATGYVGSRLVSALVREGFEVLATARSLDKLERVGWSADVDEAEMDVSDGDSTRDALAGHGRIDVAYYLVHSIGDQDFAAQDRAAAANFAERAARAGVGRIVYLGGFVPGGEELSEHLASRDEVGQELADTGLDLVWLRAAVIIGAGSTSYEMIRYLADRLPVVPIPTWVNHDVAPIAIDDVLRYLVAAAHIPPGTYDVTGPDTLPYKKLFSAYSKAAGLTRLMVPTPGVPTGLAGAVIGRLTPLPATLAEDLVDSMHNTMTGDSGPIRALVPDPPQGLTTVAAAMARAQQRPGTGRDDLAAVDDLPDPLQLAATDPQWAGGDRNETHREQRVHARADKVWAVIETIGGKNGFFSWPLLWMVRAELDKLAGGPGFTQHRADPNHLTVGDTIDFLTVVAVEHASYVRFGTDRWTPGIGSLELWIEPGGDPAADPVDLHLRARWRPTGLTGRLYWLALKPFHLLIFPAMLSRIASLAESDPGTGMP